MRGNRVINFCGIFFILLSKKMQFCKINFFNWSKSDRRKLMVVSLTQGGRKLKGGKYKGSEF